MAKIGYYLFLKPLSMLPIGVLYLFSNFASWVLYRVVKYRKQVVWNNVKNSFPDKSEKEIEAIVKGFYNHFADLIFESIKLFSISQKQVIERCKILNPEVLDKIYEQGKHAILVGGHYNNWEMLAVGLNPQVKHHIAGIYAPLSNKFFDNKFLESRSKFGTGLVHKNKTPRYFREERELSATVFGADQSPGAIKKNSYWTTFLNQETAVLFGTEKYAVEYDLPVVFVGISKVKRGYYEVTFTLLEEKPTEATLYSITENHTRKLEEDINENPEFYLWTHKRWKHTKPTNLS